MFKRFKEKLFRGHYSKIEEKISIIIIKRGMWMVR